MPYYEVLRTLWTTKPLSLPKLKCTLAGEVESCASGKMQESLYKGFPMHRAEPFNLRPFLLLSLERFSGSTFLYPGS